MAANRGFQILNGNFAAAIDGAHSVDLTWQETDLNVSGTISTGAKHTAALTGKSIPHSMLPPTTLMTRSWREPRTTTSPPPSMTLAGKVATRMKRKP
jgi:hypothetical protein